MTTPLVHFSTGKPIVVQTPACDRCSVGVMDATNPHLYGECDCPCHTATHRDFENSTDYRERPRNNKELRRRKKLWKKVLRRRERRL